MASCYRRPNIERRALGRLESLREKGNRQGELSRSFGSFLRHFEKQLTDSVGSVWVDRLRINYLDRALNDEMGRPPRVVSLALE